MVNHRADLGPNEALILRDTLPAGFKVVGGLPKFTGNGGWNCNKSGGTVATGLEIICRFKTGANVYGVGALTANPLVINARAPDEADTYTNCASLEVRLGHGEEDINPDNNTPAATKDDEQCTDIIVVEVDHDVSLTKTGPDMPVELQQELGFEFDVVNHLADLGPNEALILRDTLPAGLRLWAVYQSLLGMAAGIVTNLAALLPRARDHLSV